MSIFNCQKCNNIILIGYYKTPDKKILCPECYEEIYII